MIKLNIVKKQNIVWDYRNFLLAMTEKEIRARYKSALLGFLWIFLNPLFQMLIIGLVFQNFIKVPVKNYYYYLFAGLLPWNFFSYSLTKATPSIVYERSLIQKAKFPREAIPLSIVFSNFFHFLVSVSLFVVFLSASGNLSVSSWQLLISRVSSLLFSLLWLLALTSGLSLLSSALNVKYRDVNFFIQALIILLFYATPVIYSLQILPETQISVFALNPLTYPLESFRFSLIGSVLPPEKVFWGNFVISLVIIFGGVLTFNRDSKTFSDWL